MKKHFKSVLGVTLLEVMLVLAIAAMIIVMSIRYYQSANAAQQANTAVAQITSIVAAADSLAQPTGSYTPAVTTASITSLLPTSGLTTPWGTTIAIGGVGASSYTITLPSTPANICPLIRGKMVANAHFNSTAPTACAAAAVTNLVLTYVSNV